MGHEPPVPLLKPIDGKGRFGSQRLSVFSTLQNNYPKSKKAPDPIAEPF